MHWNDIHPDLRRLYQLVAAAIGSNNERTSMQSEQEANDLMAKLTEKLNSIEEHK